MHNQLPLMDLAVESPMVERQKPQICDTDGTSISPGVRKTRAIDGRDVA